MKHIFKTSETCDYYSALVDFLFIKVENKEVPLLRRFPSNGYERYLGGEPIYFAIVINDAKESSREVVRSSPNPFITLSELSLVSVGSLEDLILI